VFNPKGIECRAIRIRNGQVFGTAIIENLEYFTRTEVTDKYIYTEAVSNRKYFQEILSIDAMNIFKDKYGIPNANFSNNPVSITHHGKFERRIQLDVKSKSRF
jgi:hypothetical protein